MICKNLKVDFVRSGLKQKSIADFLEMSLGNLEGKINGAVAMTVDELVAVRNGFFAGKSLDDFVGEWELRQDASSRLGGGDLWAASVLSCSVH